MLGVFALLFGVLGFYLVDQTNAYGVQVVTAGSDFVCSSGPF